MIRVAIFASGTGSNFEKLANDLRLKKVMHIETLICDRLNAPVIKKAKSLGIKTFVFNPKMYDSKQAYEQDILEQVKQCELLILAGYMRIISPFFLNAYTGSIVNLHPSLLPNYKGKDAIKQAYDAKEKIIGISVHYVNEELDGGQVIAQQSLCISDGESLSSVTERIHHLEHTLFPEVIYQWIIKKEKSNE